MRQRNSCYSAYERFFIRLMKYYVVKNKMIIYKCNKYVMFPQSMVDYLICYSHNTTIFINKLVSTQNVQSIVTRSNIDLNIYDKMAIGNTMICDCCSLTSSLYMNY